jgi:hypothetical protein
VLGVVVLSYVDGFTSPDTSRWYIKGRLASLYRTEIRAAQMTRSAGSVNKEWTNDVTLQLISEYESMWFCGTAMTTSKNGCHPPSTFSATFRF